MKTNQEFEDWWIFTGYRFACQELGEEFTKSREFNIKNLARAGFNKGRRVELNRLESFLKEESK